MKIKQIVWKEVLDEHIGYVNDIPMFVISPRYRIKIHMTYFDVSATKANPIADLRHYHSGDLSLPKVKEACQKAFEAEVMKYIDSSL